MSDFLKSLAKELDDEAFILADEPDEAVTQFIDTGSYILNALLSANLYGGLADNKVTALAGLESVGKTYLLLAIMKNFLAHSSKAAVVFFETEGATDKGMVADRGIDTSRILFVEPNTVQEFKNRALRIIDAYEKVPTDKRTPLMFALDSLGQLSTSKEVEDTTQGKDTRDMTRAQVIKAAFRVITLRMKKLHIPFIVTNHVYEVVGSYVPKKELSGGGGLKYAASQIIFLSKSKAKDGTGADAQIIGNIIRASTHKSRLSREHMKVETRILYDGGLDRYYGLLDLAEKAGVFKNVAKKYTLPSGKSVFGKQIEESPEEYFTKDVLNQLNVYVNKAFRYAPGEAPTTEEDLEKEIIAYQTQKGKKKNE